MVRAGLSQGDLGQPNGELLTFAVKIGPESDGHVITFEDITRQLLDQRQAAGRMLRVVSRMKSRTC